jgi:Putative Flp pilus-assembly TadE/G-like
MKARRARAEEGQVLPLFALFLIVLVGFTALAIDVSGTLSARRFYRSAADSAALAGAQDLQATGSRAVGSGDRIRARQDAMKHLTNELGITGSLSAACSTLTDADILDDLGNDNPPNANDCVLPGTRYHVSIKAGTNAIACSECDPLRSVQVGLRNEAYPLTFGAVALRQASWSVGVSSVAGLVWSKSYTIVTLRPPARLGSTYDVKDIKLDGGTHVTVSNGDVATNADMVWTGTDSWLHTDDGYGVYFADWTGGQAWPPPPTGTNIFIYVQDANYVYPAMSGIRGTSLCADGISTNCAPTFLDATTASCGAPSATVACTTPALDPACNTELTYLQSSVYTFVATQNPAKVYCYKPGIYDPTSNSNQLSVGPTDLAILMPGAYYFKKPYGGIAVGGRIIGGYRPGTEGVALMFDECNNQCTFNGNSALTIALNAGNKYPPGTSGTSATAAHDWNDQAVETTGPSAPTPHILMTLLVKKDTDGPGGTPGCYVPAYPDREPDTCNATNNRTLNLAGGGSLDVEGVQYAPTDNIEIHGGATGIGRVGQIWAWTLFYSGGTQINQQGAGSNGPGVLRLDSACTAPGTPCNP